MTQHFQSGETVICVDDRKGKQCKKRTLKYGEPYTVWETKNEYMSLVGYGCGMWLMSRFVRPQDFEGMGAKVEELTVEEELV